MTYGEKAVGLNFNPSGDGKVDVLKAQAAAFIDSCHDWREEATDSEVERMYSVAITEMQAAQMWGVKAATWRS
ncbi:MAG TPA: hypothetical protein VGG86_20845 [Roseiarcus sp.]|jgi:hypothetical protein